MVRAAGVRTRGVAALAALAALAAMLPAPLDARASDWSQVQKDPQHHGYTDDLAQPPYKLLWTIHFGNERIARCLSSVVAGEKVFIGTKAGVMHAVNLADGKEVWKYQAGGPILHTAAVVGDKVIFACLDGKVYAVSAADGKEAWTYDSGFGFSNAPLIAEDAIFIGNREGRFMRLSTDGKKVWEVDLGAPIFQTAAYNDGKVYIGSEDMFMHALAAKDGKEVWKSPKLSGQTFKDYWPLVHKGYVIVRPMIVTMEWGKAGSFPLFRWDTDKAVLEEAMKAYPAGKPLPEPVQKAQDEIAKWYADNPAYQEMYFLKESDGTVGFVSPLERLAALGGPTAPPPVMQNGLLPVPIMMGTTRWAAFDVDKQRLVDIWPVVQGNPDETHIATVSGPNVLISHCKDVDGWAAGAFNQKTRQFVRFPRPSGGASPFFDNLVNGVSPRVISGNKVVFITCSTVMAWEGQGGAQ